MNTKNCFDILFIDRDASLDEAKESYKRLVKLWHPDQYGNFPEKQKIAHEKLKEINVAYRDIIAILKHNSAESETASGGGEIQRVFEEKPSIPEKKRTTFWSQIALFVDNNILKLNRSETSEKRGALSPGEPRRQGTVSAGGNGRSEPDFQQIFKKAVREKRPKGVRHQLANNKRIRRQFGNAASYRRGTTTKRRPGDRIEKISPVGRVNRIGGG